MVRMWLRNKLKFPVIEQALLPEMRKLGEGITQRAGGISVEQERGSYISSDGSEPI